MDILREWLPDVEKFTSKVKSVDEYVRTLECDVRGLSFSVSKERQKTREVRDILDEERAEKKDERQHYMQIRELQQQLNKQKKLLDKIPKELMEEIEKQLRRERMWGAR